MSSSQDWIVVVDGPEIQVFHYFGLLTISLLRNPQDSPLAVQSAHSTVQKSSNVYFEGLANDHAPSKHPIQALLQLPPTAASNRSRSLQSPSTLAPNDISRLLRHRIHHSLQMRARNNREHTRIHDPQIGCPVHGQITVDHTS